MSKMRCLCCGFLVLGLVCLLGSVSLADPPKGKGKNKGNVVTVDLDQLPPGLAKQVRKYAEAHKAEMKKEHAKAEEKKAKAKKEQAKAEMKKAEEKKAWAKKEQAKREQEKSSTSLEARLERLLQELEELRREIRKK